jgi:hypothetical protein
LSLWEFTFRNQRFDSSAQRSAARLLYSSSSSSLPHRLLLGFVGTISFTAPFHFSSSLCFASHLLSTLLSCSDQLPNEREKLMTMSQGTRYRRGTGSSPAISLPLWLLLLFSSTVHGITYNCINRNTPSPSCCSGEITLDPNMTSIGDGAFYSCGLTGSLTIPNSVTSIGYSAFDECWGLTGSLTIPNSVTSIGDYAFYSCHLLTGSLTIPNSVTSIGGGAFSHCHSFTGSLTIPNSVTSIGGGAFSNCHGLTGSLTIPNSVTSIGGGAFSNCYGFTGSLTIPNSVTSIGRGAFYNCYGFTGSLTIPNSVTSIGGGAFSGCSGLTGSLTIPNSVTSIGDGAFSECFGFTSAVTFPNAVTTLGTDVFASNRCPWLTCCNNCTLSGAQMCLCDSSCNGVCETTLLPTSAPTSPTVSPTVVLVKYGFGVIFGYSGILDLDRAMLVSFYRDLETGELSLSLSFHLFLSQVQCLLSRCSSTPPLCLHLPTLLCLPTTC